MDNGCMIDTPTSTHFMGVTFNILALNLVNRLPIISFTLWKNLYTTALNGYVKFAPPLPQPPAPEYHPMDDVIYVLNSPARGDPPTNDAFSEPPPFVIDHPMDDAFDHVHDVDDIPIPDEDCIHALVVQYHMPLDLLPLDKSPPFYVLGMADEFLTSSSSSPPYMCLA